MFPSRPHSLFESYLEEHIHGGHLDFDGIFCITDEVAHEIIEYLKKKGLHAPKDYSIIGFDGIRKFGTFGYCCSTIVQPVQAIANACVRLLSEESFSDAPSLICLPVSYADGGTTAS